MLYFYIQHNPPRRMSCKTSLFIALLERILNLFLAAPQLKRQPRDKDLLTTCENYWQLATTIGNL